MATTIDKIEAKASMIGAKYKRNDWGIAVQSVDGTYRLLSDNGVIGLGYKDVIFHKHFAIGIESKESAKRYGSVHNRKLFTKDSFKPILNRCRILEAYVPYDIDEHYVAEDQQRCAKAALVTGLNNSYLVNYLGNVVKLRESIFSIQMVREGNSELILLKTHIISSEPIGWVSLDFKVASKPSLIA